MAKSALVSRGVGTWLVVFSLQLTLQCVCVCVFSAAWADEFQGLHNRYPQLLFPAFRVQANMMLAVLGQAFWIALRDKVAKEANRDKARAEKAAAEERKKKRRMQLAYALLWFLVPQSYWAS